MDEKKLQKSYEILKKILREEGLEKLLEHTSNILNEKLGTEHSLFDEVVIGGVINKFIVHIGYSLAKEKTIEDFEEMCNPIYRDFTHFNSIQELYETYKEYIELVREYYTNNEE